MTASATDTAPAPAAPAPAAPNTPADTAARLDAQDAQLADHEARIAGLEQRSPPPAESTGSAQADTPATAMVDSRAIYVRMNARPGGLKMATSAMSAMSQTGAGSMLDAKAIYARHNAVAAARSGRRG